MRSLPFFLLALALLPLAASLLVLAAGAVSTGLWWMHLLSMGLAGAVALSSFFLRRFAQERVAVAIIVLTLLSLTAPLLGPSSGPERWLQLGPLRLYMAPLWLPSFLAACAYAARGGKRHETGVLVAILGAGLALAAQPDFSQVLALLAGSAVLLTRFRAGAGPAVASLLALALLTTWAFWLPDPLQPVPHVEGVFALVWGQSRGAGLAVMAGALAWIVGLLAQARKEAFWLAAVAAYYSVLLLCSVWGLTPAPLLGYGAGPILGFGLLVAVSAGFAESRRV